MQKTLGKQRFAWAGRGSFGAVGGPFAAVEASFRAVEGRFWAVEGPFRAVVKQILEVVRPLRLSAAGPGRLGSTSTR